MKENEHDRVRGRMIGAGVLIALLLTFGFASASNSWTYTSESTTATVIEEGTFKLYVGGVELITAEVYVVYHDYKHGTVESTCPGYPPANYWVESYDGEITGSYPPFGHETWVWNWGSFQFVMHGVGAQIDSSVANFATTTVTVSLNGPYLADPGYVMNQTAAFIEKVRVTLEESGVHSGIVVNEALFHQLDDHGFEIDAVWGTYEGAGINTFVRTHTTGTCIA